MLGLFIRRERNTMRLKNTATIEITRLITSIPVQERAEGTISYEIVCRQEFIAIGARIDCLRNRIKKTRTGGSHHDNKAFDRKGF
jgi:hypothetical protein